MATDATATTPVRRATFRTSCGYAFRVLRPDGTIQWIPIEGGIVEADGDAIDGYGRGCSGGRVFAGERVWRVASGDDYTPARWAISPTAAGPGLEDLAEAHAQTVQIDRYLDAVEAEARESLARVERAFDGDPSPEGLASINYLESVIMAVLTARRLLRTPDLLAAAAAVEANPPTADNPWRIAHGRLALRIITNGARPDALERLADLLT